MARAIDIFKSFAGGINRCDSDGSINSEFEDEEGPSSREASNLSSQNDRWGRPSGASRPSVFMSIRGSLKQVGQALRGKARKSGATPAKNAGAWARASAKPCEDVGFPPVETTRPKSHQPAEAASCSSGKPAGEARGQQRTIVKSKTFGGGAREANYGEARQFAADALDLQGVGSLQKELVAKIAQHGFKNSQVSFLTQEIKNCQHMMMVEAWPAAHQLLEEGRQHTLREAEHARKTERQCRDMQASYLREVSALRDQIRGLPEGTHTAVKVMHLEPINHLDEATRELVLLCVKEHFKQAVSRFATEETGDDSELARLIREQVTSCHRCLIDRAQDAEERCGLAQAQTKKIKEERATRVSEEERLKNEVVEVRSSLDRAATALAARDSELAELREVQGKFCHLKRASHKRKLEATFQADREVKREAEAARVAREAEALWHNLLEGTTGQPPNEEALTDFVTQVTGMVTQVATRDALDGGRGEAGALACAIERLSGELGKEVIDKLQAADGTLDSEFEAIVLLGRRLGGAMGDLSRASELAQRTVEALLGLHRAATSKEENAETKLATVLRLLGEALQMTHTQLVQSSLVSPKLLERLAESVEPLQGACAQSSSSSLPKRGWSKTRSTSSPNREELDAGARAPPASPRTRCRSPALRHLGLAPGGGAVAKGPGSESKAEARAGVVGDDEAETMSTTRATGGHAASSLKCGGTAPAAVAAGPAQVSVSGAVVPQLQIGSAPAREAVLAPATGASASKKPVTCKAAAPPGGGAFVVPRRRNPC